MDECDEQYRSVIPWGFGDPGHFLAYSQTLQFGMPMTLPLIDLLLFQVKSFKL
jgi:hypothetical protein